MTKYIALALFFLASTAIAGEVSVTSNDLTNDSSSNSAGDTSGDPQGDASPDGTQDSTIPADAGPDISSSEDTNSSVSQDAPPMDATVQMPQKSAPSYNDGTKDGTSVPVRLKTPQNTPRNTPWKRPDIEVSILAGGTGSYIPVNETLIDTRAPGLANAPQKYRFHLSGEGFSGGASIGPMWRRGDNSFGAVMTGYLDTHTLKNYDHKKDAYSTNVSDSMTLLSRSYTLEFAAKAGHYFNDIHLYGKLGFMCSAFQYKYRNVNDNVDGRKSMTAWGGVAGLGLQKPITLPVLNEAKIGLEYDYQIYQSLKPVIRYDTHKDTSKFRPRYHSGYLTLTKTF
jgi:hypothetical protein